MKVHLPVVNPVLLSRLLITVTDEYARKHEAELLRKLKAEVCTTRIPVVHSPDSVL
jgi:hypothetical protein